MKLKEKLQKLRLQTISELKNHKFELLKELFNLRMQKGTKNLKHNHHFSRIRCDIARIYTVLSEKDKVSL